MNDSLIQLDKQLLLALNGSHSLYADGLIKTLTSAQTWIPLYIALFYLVIKNNESIKKIITIIGCTVLCVLMAGTLDDMVVKPLVARWRPSHDPQIGMLVDVVNGYRGGSYGFFSAHAANTFSIAIFFTLLVRDKMLTLSLIAWSLTNCWTRIYLGVHYPSDILTGIIWGGISAVAVYFLYSYMMRKDNQHNNFISTQYSSTGYVLSDIDIVISVLVYTFMYAQIRACLF